MTRLSQFSIVNMYVRVCTSIYCKEKQLRKLRELWRKKILVYLTLAPVLSRKFRTVLMLVKWLGIHVRYNVCSYGQFILTRSTEHGARMKWYAARSTGHGWKFPSKANFNFPIENNIFIWSCARMICTWKYELAFTGVLVIYSKTFSCRFVLKELKII